MRHQRAVAGLDDLARQEAILAVLDGHAEDVAVLEDGLELDEHVAAIRGEAARQAHHRVQRALEVLEQLLAEEVLDGLHAREPVLVGVGDVDAAADRGDVGRGEARHQLRAPRCGSTMTSESTETMISASRLAHRVVDALALAHVVRVAQHA